MSAQHEPIAEDYEPEHGWLRLPAPPVSLRDFEARPDDTGHRYEVTDGPLRVREPDLVVLGPEADLTAPRQPADHVLVTVEIIAPSSIRTDAREKPDEYAEAGIPHYWLVDLTAPASLTMFDLAGEFGYQESPAATGTLTVHEPFHAQLNLAALPAY